MEDKKKIIVICGPTASGKTGLSLHIAYKFGGEIISADSMQIYKNLDVGTAKATKEEQAVAPHHLVDIMDPSEPYSVQLFTEMAATAIDQIYSRGNIPVIAGGLIETKQELTEALKNGAEAISTGKKELWYM